MNREEQQKSACADCGSISPCWKKIDESRDWGKLGTGERWHCDNCDAYLVIRPFEPTDHEPVRGSEVETWIKANRDVYDKDLTDTMEDKEWHALDDLLELYRAMADEGITLLEARTGGKSHG